MEDGDGFVFSEGIINGSHFMAPPGCRQIGQRAPGIGSQGLRGHMQYDESRMVIHEITFEKGSEYLAVFQTIRLDSL